ncbi:hypothetical protein O6R05_03220 [Peptoniphilus equinus]|uniref:Uncharacterized protein n=1 Tax=Peptoniphilus equinus TaxID=3016343 RepID=A0ABY7QUV1_9FIRM|nr:hypothetical protein [Peptoniphilus equinus]WBW50569.1 hypothetical protein O6R05_03220 [Peptoniphilus equinus]
MKRGFALLSVVLVFAIVLIAVSYFFDANVEHGRVLSRHLETVQGDLIAESAIQVAMEEVKHQGEAIMSNGEMDFHPSVLGTSATVTVTRQHQSDFVMEAKVTYKDIEASYFGSGTLIHPMYTKGLGVISPRVWPVSEVTALDHPFKRETKSYLLPDEDLYMRGEGYYITILRKNAEGMLEPVEQMHNSYPYFEQRAGSLTILDGDIYGVLDVANLSIEGNSRLHGLLYMNGDVVSCGGMLQISGIVLNPKGYGENNLDVTYSFYEIQSVKGHLVDYYRPTLRRTSPWSL